jgi:hypothetical protein
VYKMSRGGKQARVQAASHSKFPIVMDHPFHGYLHLQDKTRLLEVERLSATISASDSQFAVAVVSEPSEPRQLLNRGI